VRATAQADERLARLLAADLAIYRRIVTAFQAQHAALQSGELACVAAG
jgi:hypothetical protein